MSKKQTTLATVSVAFHDDGDATFKFDVNKDVKRPSTETLEIIAFAKLFSELVEGLAGSSAMPQIRQLVGHVAGNRDHDD